MTATDKIDETLKPSLNFIDGNLVAAIAQDWQTGEILMLAWMNEEAFLKTLETREAYYWSRSRSELWHKGATSGAIQKVHDIRVDCDQDAVVLLIEQTGGGACHTGRRSCFYRRVEKQDGNKIRLVMIGE